MSTIKSSAEHLTLNADGASKDIKFQANGVEKASISSAGAFTSTTIDATKLTGNLPAISGASLTNLPAGGKLLQFTSAIFRGAVTTMSGSWVAMPDNLSITPISATSKLYVMATSGNLFFRNAQFGYQIFRDGSQTSNTSDDFQIYVHNSSGSNVIATLKLNCVVTSGSTAATNFKVYGKGSGDYSSWSDSADNERLITIMEIEA